MANESKLKPFIQNTSNVFGQNRLLKILLCVMTICVWLIYVSVQDFKNHQQTIVIPGGQRPPYEIRNYEANDTYIFDMANYITHLAGNASPSNVESRLNILLGLFHESSYPRYQTHFKKLAKEIKRFKNISHISELAYPDPLFVRENQLRIRINKSKIVGSTIKPSVVNYLIVDYRIIDGRFWIMNMKEMNQTEYNEVLRDEK